MTGFMKLLINKDRYGELPKIFQYLIDRIREERKIGTAFVTTAVELSTEKKAAVQKRLLETTDYQTMEVCYSVDESIIGGMIIRIKDRVVDSSVRTKLEEMKKQLLQIQLG
jgi:F-type H+-transporting ATPase subunit delta